VATLPRVLHPYTDAVGQRTARGGAADGTRDVDRNKPASHEAAGYIALLDGNAEQADTEFRMEPLHMVRLYTTAVSQYSLGHLTVADSALSELIKDFSRTLV
jgi:hypothetical protein